MGAIEVVLIIIGVIFMIGSFFVTEKLSSSELDKISALSEKEIKIITNKELEKASGQIEEHAETVVEESMEKIERSLDKETNEKIMQIGEYSDTVLENMNKTHNEIMFLYSMLNDKHTELTDLAGGLSTLAGDLEQLEGKMQSRAECTVPETVTEEKTEAESTEEPELIVDNIEQETKEDETNNNTKILELYNEGKSYVEIARELKLGLGEVKLVVELFRGDE